MQNQLTTTINSSASRKVPILLHFYQVIILKKPIYHIPRCTTVLAIPVHLIPQPLTLVVTVVCPCVCALTLAVAVLEVSVVNVAIRKPVFAYFITKIIPKPFFFPSTQFPS
jgi:hypothetical protein